MGIIRFLLAVAVVSGHLELPMGAFMIPGDRSVECFFIISGFYMGMIFSNYRTKSDFYLSRFFRLFPTYLFCLLLAIGGGYFAYKTNILINIWHKSHGGLLTFCNLFCVFTDFIHLLGAFSLRWDFDLLLRQAWSLSHELYFYLLLPLFGSMKKQSFICIFLSSFLLKIIFHLTDPMDTVKKIGLSYSAWSYFFFPSQLYLFMAGLIVQKYVSVINDYFIRLFVLFFIVSLIIFYYTINTLFCSYFFSSSFPMFNCIFSILFACTLPTIFAISRDNKIDRCIGECSYFIYLSHFAVRQFLGKLENAALYTLVISTVLGLTFNWLIQRRIDEFRLKFKTLDRR